MLDGAVAVVQHSTPCLKPKLATAVNLPCLLMITKTAVLFMLPLTAGN